MPGKILRRALIVSVCVIALFCIAATALTLAERGRLKQYVVTTLNERFHSDVQIHDISVYVYPRVYIVAHGVSLRQNGRSDYPPLLVMKTLTISAGLRALLGKTKHVARVYIDGLDITVPPRPLLRPEGPKPPKKQITLPVVIDEIVADNATLTTLPRDPSKVPREWQIHRVVMTAFSFDDPAHFHATLTNPKPIGEIDSSGEFGPWDAEEPGNTPLSNCTFSFSHADLDSLKGLGGILSSQGKYDGVLDTLNVEGDTDTPDFSLDVSGNPVHLTTHYVAQVDGTNGDTTLMPVTAHFLNTTVVAKGDILGIRGLEGKDIELNSVIRSGRVEDLMHLVMKTDKPVMTGDVSLTAKISLPPRPGVKVFDRLGLDGKFGIIGRFTSDTVQDKVDTLSRKGQGQPKNEGIDNVISNLRGAFVLKDRRANFSDLEFDVQGAAIQLSGTYNMADETLDFHGHLVMNAKLSQMTTGVKSFFLKAVDPFVSKNGQTDLKIKITGTRSHPSFGLDRGHGDDAKKPDSANLKLPNPERDKKESQ